MISKILLLILGVICCSSSVIFIKLSTEHPILLAAYRLLIAAVALTPVFVRNAKNYSFKQIRPAILPGMVLGIHFISWNMGARMTLAANASLIVSIVPIVMPLFLFILLRELTNRQEIIGTAVAIAGIALLGSIDIHLSRTTFLGDLICFIAMILFAYYLALARKNRDYENIWLYIVPVYYIAGILCFIITLFFENPIKMYTTENILYMLGLGIVPTVIGHSIFNYSMQHIRGQVVSIAIMSQFVFGGVMGFFFLGEVPHPFFYIASILLIGGAVISLKSQKNVVS
ncbi:MAG: DMT family transporter [Spirochaetota bacterium]|nr:MAG: DMT family transporter [Spirochaetota bacterium]